MLVQVGDWYRAIQPVANDERLAQRRASAARLAETWERAVAATALDVVALVLGLVGGASSTDGQPPILDAVVDAMTQDQPSLDRAAARGHLDPRICAAVALGEVLSRSVAAPTARRNGVEAVLAGALASALRYRDLAPYGHAGQILSELLDLAERLLDAFDQRRRTRRDGPVKRFDRTVDAEGADVRKAVKELVSGLNAEMLKDREELQALWWMFGAHSLKAGRPFELLTPGEAALYAGMELAELVEPPATRGIAALAGRMVRTGREATTTLPVILDSVGARAWAELKPTGAAGDLVRGHASLFPVIHAASRVKGQNGTGPVDVRPDAPVLGLDLVTDASGLAQQTYGECALLRSARGG